MSLSWLITNAVASFLLPPMSLVLLGLIGALLLRRHRKTGVTLVTLAVLLLLGLSTSAGSRLLVKPLEDRYVPVPDPKASGARAIVVLGGGRDILSPEDADRDRPSTDTLMRLRHGARLHRQTGLPLLVSGGNPDGQGESEAGKNNKGQEYRYLKLHQAAGGDDCMQLRPQKKLTPGSSPISLGTGRGIARGLRTHASTASDLSAWLLSRACTNVTCISLSDGWTQTWA